MRNIGIIIIVFSVILLWPTLSLTLELNTYLHTLCIAPDGTCPHASSLPWQSYVALSLITSLILVGIYTIYSGMKKSKEIKETETNKEETIKTLNDEEKNVFMMIRGADGMIFQQEIIDRTDLGKVKVTRILDKLESKKLIERRRRGMSNVVIIK